MQSKALTPFELRRFADNLQMPGVGQSGQEKLRGASVLVVGAGGKGCSAMQNLVAAGLGYLGISDNFGIEEETIYRQSLYGVSDTGKQKAIVARERLKSIADDTIIELHNICLSEKIIDIIARKYDVLVDATDNFPARYLINDAAVRLNKPVVFGSVYGPQVQVSVFNYRQGPSLRCAFPETPKGGKKPPLSGMVSTGILTHTAGAIMANEALKIILGMKEVLSGNMLVFDFNSYQITLRPIERNQVNFGAV